MSNKAGLTLFAAGLLAATAGFAPYAPSAAQERPAISTDFSAQQQQENKGQQKKAAPAARPAPQRAAPQRAAPQRAAPHEQRDNEQRHTSSSAPCGPLCITKGHFASSQATEGHMRAVKQPKATSRAVSSRKPRHVRSGNRRPLRKRSPRLPVVARGIARCRSAGRHTTRHQKRHCIALARGAGARRRPRCYPRPKLLGVA